MQTVSDGAESTTRNCPARRHGLTFLEVLAAVAILFLLVALLMPARRTVGEAARRSQCVNNLKQIALALQNYQAEYGVLPPAYTVDAEGRRLHSWRTLILPFISEKSLYETIDLTRSWDDPVNAEALARIPNAYRCPSTAFPRDSSKTVYCVVVDPAGCFPGSDCCSYEGISDGRANTLLVCEVPADQAVTWMAPDDTTAVLFTNTGPKAQFPHSGGRNIALADGSVKYLKADTPAATLQALVTIAGGDTVAPEK